MTKSNVVEIAEGRINPVWLGELPQDGSVLDVIANKFRKVIDLEESLAAEVEVITNNVELTDIGKSARLKEAGLAALTKITGLSDEVEGVIPKLVANAKAKAKPEESEAMQAVAMNRATATYKFIADEVGTDQLALEIKMREAEAAGDAETISAIIDGPQSWPLAKMFDRDALTARRDALIDGGTPAIENAQTDLMNRLAWSAADIREDTGLAAPDKLAEIADADLSATG